ncbi:MAG: PAS domain-containing protein [Balneolales bacterium]|nr:PAS domain-containing protein [Balneolales bacterium]
MDKQPFSEDAEDLYQNAPFGYLSMHTDGSIININNTLLEWLNYERSEILFKKKFQDLLSIGGKIYFETHIMPLLQMQGDVHEINIDIKGRNDSKLPALINARRIENTPHNKPVYRFSVLNITQRKQYELELMIAKKKAEETVQRLQQINKELEQFAYTASHDLQAPLNSISMLLAMMKRKGYFTSDSDGETYYSLIENNTSRMKLMIKDLLDYSKIDGADKTFEEICLKEVCNSAVSILHYEIDSSKAVISVSDLPKILGDRIQLMRLFQNLLGNAIKYRSAAPPEITVGSTETENEVQISIKDNGIGFDQKYAQKIFEFMKRLHSHDSIPGTGIGLAACSRIVEIHGGKIWAKSEPGKGSVFYFTLPKSRS